MARRYAVVIDVKTIGTGKARVELQEIGGASGKAAAGMQKVVGAAKVMGGALAAAGVLKFAKDVLSVGASMETLIARLKTGEGSLEAAQERFRQLNAFAEKTPFQLQEVTDAYVRLKNLGIQPTVELMTASGNIAASQSKSLVQFTEAVADAAVGEFERLKEFGVKARSEGDQVVFTFKGAETRIQKNAAAIVGYLEEIGNTDFASGMSDQMETAQGKLSNLKDAWSRLLNTLFAGGAGDVYKKVLEFLTDAITWIDKKIKAIGSLRGAWAFLKAAVLEATAGMVRAVHELGANTVREISAIVSKLGEFVKVLVPLAEWQDKLNLGMTDNASTAREWADALQSAGRRVSETADQVQARGERAAQELERLAQVAVEEGFDAIAAQMQDVAAGLGDTADQGERAAKSGATAEEKWAAFFEAVDRGNDYLERMRVEFEEIEDTSGEAYDRLIGGAKKLEDLQKPSVEWTETLHVGIRDVIGVLDLLSDSLDGTIAKFAQAAASALSMFRQIKQQGGGAGAGIAGAIGGFLGSSNAFGGDGGNYMSEFAAVGSLFGPWGTAVGAIVGSFVKKGLDTAQIYITNEFSRISGDSSLFGAVQDGADSLVAIMRQLASDIGAELGSFEVGLNQRGDQINVFIKGMRATFADMSDAVNFLVTELAKTEGVLTGASAQIQTVLRNTAATTVEQLQADLAVALRAEALQIGSDRAGIRASINEMMRQLTDELRLGLDGSGGGTGLVDSLKNFRNQILGISESVEERVRRQAAAFEAERLVAIAQLTALEAKLVTEATYTEESLNLHGDLYQGMIEQQGIWAQASLSMSQGVAETSVQAAQAAGAALQAVRAAIASLQDLEITEQDIADAIAGLGQGGGGGNRRARREAFEAEIAAILRSGQDAIQQLLGDHQRQLAELADAQARFGVSAEDYAEALRILDEQLQQNIQSTIDEGFVSILRGLSGLIDDEKLLIQLREIEAGFQIANARMQLELLRDYLSPAQIALIEQFIAAAEDGLLAIASAGKTLLDSVREGLTGKGGGKGDGLGGRGGGGVVKPPKPPPDLGGGSGGAGNVSDYWERLRRGLEQLNDELMGIIRTADRSNTGRLAELNERFRDILARAREFGGDMSLVARAWRVALNDLRDSMLEGIRSLREEILGSEDGPLSFRGRLESAQSRFAAVVGRLRSGDINALQDLPEVARLLREQAGGFFGSDSAAFRAIQAQILSALNLAESLQFGGGIGNAQGGFSGGGPVSTDEAIRQSERHQFAALQEAQQHTQILAELRTFSRETRDAVRDLALLDIQQAS